MKNTIRRTIELGADYIRDIASIRAGSPHLTTDTAAIKDALKMRAEFAKRSRADIRHALALMDSILDEIGDTKRRLYVVNDEDENFRRVPQSTCIIMPPLIK